MIAGAQIIYKWKELEPKQGEYHFQKVQNDLAYLNKLHKKLIVQLQDRSFLPTVINTPPYIKRSKQIDFAGGNITNQGWVANTWDSTVAKSFHALLRALAHQFDGKIYAINLPETAIDISTKHAPIGFTPEKYFASVINNMRVLQESFQKTKVIQYVNFFPGEWLPWTDKNFMSRIFAYAKAHHIGLGGPDIVPYRKGQMQNSYKYFHQYKGQLSEVVMAIQSPDYRYINPKTKQKYTTRDFICFAIHYLGVDHLVWTVNEPFFSKKLVPMIRNKTIFSSC